MKPFYSRPVASEAIVTIRKDQLPHFPRIWHFHDEIELVCILESTGIRIIGDHVSRFNPGDVVLLGSRLPHIWMNDPEIIADPHLRASALIMHLHRDLMNRLFRAFPEFDKIIPMMKQASRGIRFSDPNGDIRMLLGQVQEREGLLRLSALWSLFDRLLHHQDRELLAGALWEHPQSSNHDDRLNRVFAFVAQHFQEKITLQQLADLAHMTPPAFCNYFKQCTGKTPFGYLIDLRLSYARKLLIETGLSITTIAHRCGYSNSAFFTRQFRQYQDCTPTQYRQNWQPSPTR